MKRVSLRGVELKAQAQVRLTQALGSIPLTPLAPPESYTCVSRSGVPRTKHVRFGEGQCIFCDLTKTEALKESAQVLYRRRMIAAVKQVSIKYGQRLDRSGDGSN